MMGIGLSFGHFMLIAFSVDPFQELSLRLVVYARPWWYGLDFLALWKSKHNHGSWAWKVTFHRVS
jgi:hypothetical protein